MTDQRYPEPTVGALILNLQGQLFLMKSPKWRGKYVVPGGHVELGESLEEALRREIKEVRVIVLPRRHISRRLLGALPHLIAPHIPACLWNRDTTNWDHFVIRSLCSGRGASIAPSN